MTRTAASTIETIVGEGELGRASAETREVLRKYHNAFRTHDTAALVDLVHDDCVIENTGPAPNGSRHIGKAACLQLWQGIAGNKDGTFEHEEIFVVGDRCITRWRYRWGTGDGESLRGINVMRVRDGRFVEAFGYAKR
jgi:ketosteroid isomerase-like protein